MLKSHPNLGAGGATSFVFDRGEVFGWNMKIQGSRERVLDSVLPHEVTHTIFASYFRQPLPRWADEGACTTVEHRSEIAKQERMLIDFLKTGRGIPFSTMFAMKEYPPDVMPLYSQGHSLGPMADRKRGRKAFLEFLADGMQDENWPRAVREALRLRRPVTLQNSWHDWVKQGRPQLAPSRRSRLATLAVARRSRQSFAARARTMTSRRSATTAIAASIVAASVARATARSMPQWRLGPRNERRPATVDQRGPSVYDASLPNDTMRR